MAQGRAFNDRGIVDRSGGSTEAMASTGTRRLAAILAADVAGYSRLMGVDEQGTFDRLKAIHRQLVEPKITEHHGRIVKTTGDGLLAEFSSVVDAVRCAVEIQRAMLDCTAEEPEKKRIIFRIGLNLGDIIVDRDDIFGDSVNIAARLEALAEPGGICISRTVRDHIGDRLPYNFRDLGEQCVKNIGQPVHAYAMSAADVAATVLVAASIQTRDASPQRLPAADDKSAPRLSIVVLPFANLSNDPDQEYFADGITNDLTTDLSRISGSFVIARNTAFTYKNKPTDIKQVGRELNVHYVLEGSVRRMGDQVRVNAQLIDTESGAHLWADRFDTNFTNLVEAQSDITGRLAYTLNIELLSDASRRIERESSLNPDARDLVMRGWAWWYGLQTQKAGQEALRAFERALEIDPRSADARIGIARILVARLASGWNSTSSQQDAAQHDVARVERLLFEAIDSDPNRPMAYAVMGLLRRMQSRLAELQIALKKAISLDPNFEWANMQLGWTLLFQGEPSAAIARGEKSLRLTPRDPNIYWRYELLGWCQLVTNHVDQAIDLFIEARTANPRIWTTAYGLAGALALKGDLAGAKAALGDSLRLRPEVNSLAQWYAWLPWTSKTSAPQF